MSRYYAPREGVAIGLAWGRGTFCGFRAGRRLSSLDGIDVGIALEKARDLSTNRKISMLTAIIGIALDMPTA
jgi:hypothetical protein